MLDEIVEKQKDIYLVTNLMFSLDRQIPDSLKKAFYFRFVPLKSDEASFFNRHFGALMKDSELIKGVREAIHNQTPIRCFYFESDSSKIGLYADICDNYLKEVLENLGYTEQDYIVYKWNFDELFTNAVAFGNKAANRTFYEGLGKFCAFNSSDPVLIDKEIEENKRKEILLEMVLWDRVTITRVSDTGIGFDLKKAVETSLEMDNIDKIGSRGFVMARAHEHGYLKSKFFDEKTNDYSQTTFVTIK